MSAVIGFQPTEEDNKIIQAAQRKGERTSDVIRRALHLLERDMWILKTHSDAERLSTENLPKEEDVW
jgi:antitoxin ParD1/3/4